MAIILDSDYGDVVKVDGICYEKTVQTIDPPTHIIENPDVFASCETCADSIESSSNSSSGGISSDSSESSSQSVVAALCPDTCPTVSGFVNPPSMELTLFDADYAGGSITWAGQTWTQQEVKDGVTKCSCPTGYGFEHKTTGNPQRGLHFWGNGFGLLLDRVASTGTSFSNFQRHKVRVVPNGTSPYYQDYRYKASFSTSSFQLGLLNAGSALVTRDDFIIPNNFFGSYVNGDLTYSWAKGSRWP